MFTLFSVTQVETIMLFSRTLEFSLLHSVERRSLYYGQSKKLGFLCVLLKAIIGGSKYKTTSPKNLRNMKRALLIYSNQNNISKISVRSVPY